jgi:mannosyl-3-phosphoglycerate synthase
MVIGLLIAKMLHRDYVGFIDSDNYLPGAVNEYVKIFAAGFGMSNTPYSNVRISWQYKPVITSNSLHFAKWERASEATNMDLNSLLSHITGFETDIITTANSGDHALSISLAECLHFSSGFAIEPYELIDILEKFGGLLPSEYAHITEKGVEVFQIETRNPHFHEDKDSNLYLTQVLKSSLLDLYHSKICPPVLAEEIRDRIETLLPRERRLKKYIRKKSMLTRNHLLDPIRSIQISEFGKLLQQQATTLSRYGSL